MERLCDEILQIIVNELDDPTSFSLLSHKYHAFTRDPYVRASYFLSRYGRIQALFGALGRGRLMSETVIDTLLSAGAHLSRYLAQCAMHHYYRTAQVPFIKTPWVRSMDLCVFTHFQSLAVRLYGSIPLGKGDDDGALFDAVIKESRFPADQRSTKWETLRDVLETYKFMPFCNKDAMMANFPLALSIEPSLLPYARANGFHMDHKYRDFVFRKMFEKPAIAFEARADEIVRNVQELTRLDPRMFLTRTVAAEICLEVKTNEAAYNALKRLDKEGMLKFELPNVVTSLIKTYANTRSVSNANSYAALRQLYMDFPSSDPVVRHVLLLQVFLSQAGSSSPPFPALADSSHKEQFVQTCKEKIESIGLGPVKRSDLLGVLANSFAPDKFEGILEYGRTVLKMSQVEVEDLVQEVAFRCLENGCKGKMLAKLVSTHTFLEDAIRQRVVQSYKLDVEDLPAWQDEHACTAFEAPLCHDYMAPRRYRPEDIGGVEMERGEEGKVQTAEGQTKAEAQVQTHEEGSGSGGNLNRRPESGRKDVVAAGSERASPDEEDDDLGTIGQDALSSMIRKDELAPARGRRRFFETFANFQESQSKLPYPSDCESVGRWIRKQYGPRSSVTAIFMLHGVINGSPSIVQPYLAPGEAYVPANRVPITLKHFKMLARLGRAPAVLLFDDIQAGAEFYFSEDDHLRCEESASGSAGARTCTLGKRRHSRIRIKPTTEYAIKSECILSPSTSIASSASTSTMSRRSRRGVGSAVSYVVPDSDDEMIVDEDEEVEAKDPYSTSIGKRRAESNLQTWIKHLSLLHKEEQRKYKERRRNVLAAAEPYEKVKVPKSDFHKSLSVYLTKLRKVDKQKREQLYGANCPEHYYSSGDEDEYHARPVKRLKTGP